MWDFCYLKQWSLNQFLGNGEGMLLIPQGQEIGSLALGIYDDAWIAVQKYNILDVENII